MKAEADLLLTPHVGRQNVGLRFSEADVFMACENRLLPITTNITNIQPKMRGMCRRPSAMTPLVYVRA